MISYGSLNVGFWLQNNYLDISDKTVDLGAIRSVDYREVTDEIISSIAAEDKLKYIQISKELPDKAYQIVDRILAARPDMTFRIWGLISLKHYDISYLHRMPHLKNLIISCHLSSTPDLIDFSLLKGLPLKSLGLDTYDLKDYSFIKDLSGDIEQLTVCADAKGRNVNFDCRWLLKFKKMKSLFLGSREKKNISCLSEMSSLKDLSIRGITLDDLSFLKDMRLEKLSIYRNLNYDLSALGEVTTLKEIDLWRVERISNVDFLEKLTSLEKITLESLKHVTALPDLSGLKDLRSIELTYTGIKPETIDERLKPITVFHDIRPAEHKPVKKEKNKKKNIYTARINVDDELLSVLGPDRTGCMETWYLQSKGASYTAYLFVPDLNKTDTFSFDLLFDDEFRKHNDLKIGDHFPVTITHPDMLRQIEITGITQGEPINNRENKRPVRHRLSETTHMFDWYLYHYLKTDECRGEDGWFSIEELIRKFADMWYLLDLETVETIVNNDEDHRYILSDDKTKIRISPEHPAPKTVEEQLKTVDGLKVKWSAFVQNKLPSIKNRKLGIHVECSNGTCFDFPYQTNKIFFMDEKHFFMLVEQHEDPMLAVSSYMCKDGGYRYRTAMKGFPDVINNLYPDYPDFIDFEDNIYRFKFTGRP